MAVLLQTPLVIRDDDDLIRAAARHPGYHFEREADGAILVSPTSTSDDAKSAEALFQLASYAKEAGGKAFDSSSGFAIGPGRTVRSPDASWISPSQMESLSERPKTGFWPVSPAVVIEVRSSTDNFAEVTAKTAFYVERGTQYAVAIDPQNRAVKEFGEAPAGLALDFTAIMDA